MIMDSMHPPILLSLSFLRHIVNQLTSHLEEAEMIVVDGALSMKYSEHLHSVLLQRGIPIIIMYVVFVTSWSAMESSLIPCSNMTSEQKNAIIDQMSFGTVGSSCI
jgi:hypothetical protein